MDQLVSFKSIFPTDESEYNLEEHKEKQKSKKVKRNERCFVRIDCKSRKFYLAFVRNP